MRTLPATCRRGQVLVVTLLAIVLLVGLIFFVLNLGDQVNRRVISQNAADAAALSGGIQMARSMNAVAMTNLSMSRMLAAIVTLDGLERHTEASLSQAEAFHARMRIQAARPLPSDHLQPATRASLQNIRDQLERERDLLGEYVPVVQALDLRLSTTYTISGDPGPPPHGAFWRAMTDLDLLNQATVESAGTLAQAGAARHAAGSQADGGLLVPIIPTMPALRGEWEDWYRNPARRASLLVDGWPPELEREGIRPPVDRYDDYDEEEEAALVAGRGPFFTHMNWRWADRTPIFDDAVWLPGGSRYGSRPGQPTASTWRTTGYRAYGPVAWMERRVYHFWRDRLHYSVPHYVRGGRVRPLLEGLQRIKLEYLFEPTFGSPRELHAPDWETDYLRARERARPEDGPEVEPELTAHFRMEYLGPFGPGDGRIRGLLDDPRHSNVHDPSWLPERGWRDREEESCHFAMGIRLLVRLTPSPDTPEDVTIPDEITIPLTLRVSASWRKVAEHIWHAEASPDDWADALARLDARGDIRRAIRSRLDLPPNVPTPDYAYDQPDFPWNIKRDIFVGADFGQETAVHNPANYPRDVFPDALPRPYLLDRRIAAYDARVPEDPHDDVHHDEGVRREHFTLLAAAYRGGQAAVWPERFATGNPAGMILAVAQVQLYNPTSWDLWTQDWQAQLVPVTGLSEWCDRLRTDMTQGRYADVRAERDRGALLELDELDALYDHLDALTRDRWAVEELIHH